VFLNVYSGFSFAWSNTDLTDVPAFRVDVELPAGAKISTRYDLLANIRHDGEPTEGSYSLHFLHKSNSQWYNVQDLIIEEKMPGDVAISEAYIQIYERQD
jgi:ubiquitin C-terminal hydrolase